MNPAIKRFLRHVRSRVKSLRHRAWMTGAHCYVRLATLQAEQYLKNHGPIIVLIDNSALGHGITHETVWIDTGTKMWGDIPIDTGYSARVPVHSADNDDRVYHEVRYLVGIAELAKKGLVRLVTSAELHAEAMRQPLGRFRGYRYQDLNIFEGIPIPSIDGHVLDLGDARAKQLARVHGQAAEPYATLARLLPGKHSLDAWHLHTAHLHRTFCLLVIDFPFVNAVRQAQRRIRFPQLNTKLMLPSELGAEIGLRPIDTYLISYRDASWFVHPEFSNPTGRRRPLQSKQPSACGNKSQEADET